MRDGHKRDFARHLRRQMADAERAIWFHLRDRRLRGCKFRRQHPVGPYVVDFVCIEARLVVELDGGQHVEARGDAVRTGYLRRCGYRVLRFWNNDVLAQAGAVLESIHRALAESRPHPSPLPHAGEGEQAGGSE